MTHEIYHFICFFFFNDTATTEIYTTANTLSLHDALPICRQCARNLVKERPHVFVAMTFAGWVRSEEHTSELQSLAVISYAVFCLKKKKVMRGSALCTASYIRARVDR